MKYIYSLLYGNFLQNNTYLVFRSNSSLNEWSKICLNIKWKLP